MSRLWKKIICLSLVLTMLVPSNVVFAAETPAEVPVQNVEEQEETVLDESAAIEEIVPEEGAEEVVPEEGTEEVVPEEGTEEIVPEEGTEEVVPEEGTEEVVPEEGTEEVVPEEGTEEVVPEEGTEEVVPEEGTVEIVIGDSFTEEAANAVVGWVGSGDSYQYIKADGTYATEEILEIGGKLYAFDDDSYMYTEGEQDFYGKDSNGSWVSGYVRAQSDGALYRNAWYYDDYYEAWYYYGANGLGVRGIQTIFGVTYYFWSDGRMATNTVVYDDDVAYIADANGYLTAATKEGWIQASGKWYYYQNGEFLNYGVYKIGGVLYGFDGDGVWCVDTEFYGQNYEKTNSGYHRAKADGTLYINSWYYDSDEEEWYYYGTNGLAPEYEILTIAGKQYYFWYDGRMAANTTFTANGVEYIAAADGSLTKVTENGWYGIDGKWYYRQNGELLEDEVAYIDGKYYGFDYEGSMYDDREFYFDGEYYRASKGGALYVNQWYYDGYDWYYYGAGGVSPSYELKTIGGVTYYFSYAGELYTDGAVTINSKVYVVDQDGVAKAVPNGWSQQTMNGTTYWYYTVNGSVVNGLYNTGSGYYVFRSSRMITSSSGIVTDSSSGKDYLVDASGKVITGTGWKLLDGDYYFLNSDYSVYYGLLTVGGQKYYCQPVMFHSGVIAIGGTSYKAGASGALVALSTDGFYHTADGSFYVSGGKVLKNTWKSINNCWYYFGSNGYAYSGDICRINNVDYIFREDGVMASSAFVTLGGETYYANAAGNPVTGEQPINGKWYFFDESGYLTSARIKTANGVSVYADNGEYVGTVSGSGWKSLNGKYYYVSEGELVRDEKMTIGGIDYIFNNDGEMYENAIVEWYDIRYGTNYYYCAAGGAVQKNGWRQFNGSYYFADATGKLYRNGEHTIGGAKYYFDTNAKMADKDFVYGGKLYKVASNGVVTGVTAASTVNLANGDVVYYQQGKPYTGWKGSKYYRSGEIMVNGVKKCGDAYYAFDKNGNYLKNTWYGSDYTWVYLQADGKAAYDQTLAIGGYTYAFDGYYMVVDSVYKGSYYDINGHRVSSVSGAGWKQYGGGWYYLVNGSPVKSRLMEIGGNTYGFAYDGYMVKGLNYVAGKVYFFNNDGVLQKYTGWRQVYGRWLYFGQDHASADGWLKDGGKQYYMDEYSGMVTGVQLIDGTLYKFDSNGVLQSGYKAADGWVKAGNTWCYVKNGKPLTSGLYQIAGSWYYFEYDGRMLVNDWTDYGYATSSGALIRERGWHALSNGKWIYIGEGNEVYRSGGYYIGGTLYVFDSNGYWV